MAWMIHTDHIAEEGEQNRVNYFEEHSRIPVIAAMIGLESEPLPTMDGEKKLPLVEFRLYDDDGELYYEGRCHDDDECLNQSAALSWAEGDSGCTTIQVLRMVGENGAKVSKWVQEIG